MDLIDEDTAQWYSTKFNLLSGHFHPFFGTLAFIDPEQFDQPKWLLQQKPLPIADRSTEAILNQIKDTMDQLKRSLTSIQECRTLAACSSQLIKIRGIIVRNIIN
jgi:hypothetical protein